MSSEAVRNVANLIQNGHAKRITLLTGAGASVASGIPDFRSPGGMYSTLKPELLTASEEDRQEMRDDPVMVVDKELFLRNALPYHEVQHPHHCNLSSVELARHSLCHQ